MTRRDNLKSLYILLFLNIAFFFFQTQSQETYVNFFSFNREAVLSGEAWRLFTYQFIQGSALSLFFNLLILYIMGSVVEEEWGTFHFIGFYLISTLGSAAVAFALGIPLIGAYFLSYSLLFAYAHMIPEQTFYIFFILPVKVKWLAWIALAILGFGVITMRGASLAAAGGAIASMAYYFLVIRRTPLRTIRLTPALAPKQGFARVAEAPPVDQRSVDASLASFQETKRVAESGTAADRQARMDVLTRAIVPGVNICPPADFKPEAEDRYCARCEGFNECSARWLRLRELEEPAVTDRG